MADPADGAERQATAAFRPTSPVTVAVVSWNTRDLLVRCLRSLAPEAEAGRAQVWVVDTGSSDGSAQAAKREAPWAVVLEPESNLGFGRAVNLVAKQTRSEWLVAANADVALEPGSLEILLASGAKRCAGCVAPRLILPSGDTQHSVYSLPTLPFTLAFNLSLYRLSRRLADHLCLEKFWDPERARDVPWAIGAFLLLRREAFDAVGGFDERQWMFAEDLDLGWRLHRAGWVTRYEPRARVLHESSAATSVAFGEQKVTTFMEATYAALFRRRGAARTWATAAVNVAGAATRVGWMTPLARISPRWQAPRDVHRRWLAAHLRGFRSARTGKQAGRG